MDKYEIYQKAELGGRVGFGEHAAILVVDFQRAFVDPEIPGGGDFHEAIGSTRVLLDEARRLGVPVFYTVVGYASPMEAGRFIEKCPTLRLSMLGTPMVELAEALGRTEEEPVLVKRFASAFFETDLAERLREAGVDTVVVCGCTTSGCVRASVIDGMQNGFRSIVPRECVADIALEPHEANLFDMDAKYGDVMSMDEVMDRLEGTVVGATGASKGGAKS